MYVAVLLVLSGWAISFGSWPLALYAAVVLCAFHLRIVLQTKWAVYGGIMVLIGAAFLISATFRRG